MVDPQSLNEIDVVTHTVYGEARAGRSYMGRTIKEVCLKPYQFSCWDHGDINRSKLLNLGTNSDEYRRIRQVVKEVLDGARPDNTRGSTHYHANYIQPDWTRGKTPTVVIGNHLFYNNID
ncbi:unnamed protein product [Rotaria magnacalcarata]|uniref:Cell wall hydrolase SleB domain-containing protein n=1 Tax=Rotaria magnacalcarata TaxID=392030 RepID=A0A819Y2P0_9BILA|nr:unnamed protein product [Rotaria magnacalcarata]CAF4151812.1 unnamed protein product [Rotaria magnacalcarata]